MLKSELKSYTSVIKGLAKTNKMSAWKSVAIRDNTIQATDLSHIFTMKTEIAGSGLYNPKALDMYVLDNTADLESFRAGELDDWVEIPKITWGAKLNLATRHARGTLGETIVYALGCVSNDMTRPALTGVWAKDGEIVSSDGYRAYMSGKMAELENLAFNLDATIVKAYKRLAKYGNWTLTIGEDDRHNQVIKLENENISLVSNQIEAQFPEIRHIAKANNTFNYKIVIPFDKVKTLQDRDNDDLEIKFDGTMTLNLRPLPFKAEIIKTDDYHYDTDQMRQIIMGLAKSQNDTLAVFSVRLAADFRTKDGKMTMRVLMPEIPSGTPNLAYSIDDVL